MESRTIGHYRSLQGGQGCGPARPEGLRHVPRAGSRIVAATPHDAFQIRGDFGNERHSNDDVRANKLIRASADAEFPDIIENQPSNNDHVNNAASVKSNPID
jgi:hypothetical protein